MAADQSSLSPIAQCLRIAAQRGRALRLAREQAQAQSDLPHDGGDVVAQPSQDDMPVMECEA
jgi:hypothetical protein